MTQIAGVMALPDFKMNDDVGGSYRYDENKCTLQVVLVYQREFTYYLWNCFIIIFGLTTLMLSVYSQMPEDRMSIDITLLLVAVTFKVLMLEQLPPVSYLTFLDWYNLVGVLFIFIGCFLHGITSYLGTHSGFEEADVAYMDKTGLLIFGLMWVLFNLVYALAVRAQLELNDAMTEVDLIKSNNYSLRATKPS